MMEQRKRLHRSRRDRRIAGVIGGWAQYLRVDPALLRLGFVLFALFTAFFPNLFLFPVMGAIQPLAPFGDLLSRHGEYVAGYAFPRIFYHVFAVFAGFGLAVFAYLLMVVIMPPEPEPAVG